MLRHVTIHNDKLNMILLTCIVLVTCAVHGQVLWFDFINLDDPVIVYSNPRILSGITFDNIHWAFTSQYVSNWVPLTMLSHMLDIQLFGLNPAGHHGMNVLFHVLNTVFLYLFLSRSTKAMLESATVALLFALHPLHVESVAWVAERKDVLSTFFWMLALYSYVFYTEKPGILRYLAVLALFAMGLMSKPMVVTLPVILLLIDWWPLGRLDSRHPYHYKISRLLVEKIPFVLLAGGVAAATFIVKQSEGEIVTTLYLLERVLRAFSLYLEYIYKTLWPANLAIYYPLSDDYFSTTNQLVSMIVIALISGFALLTRKTHTYFAIGWTWFLVTLLPVIGIIQSGACIFADRYMYIPIVGLLVVAVWGIAGCAATWKNHQLILGGLFLLVISVATILTVLQLRHWKDSVSVLSHALAVTENNWLALNNLGLAYLGKGKVDDAIWYFNESVRAKPSNVVALVNLGALYSVKNQHDPAIEVLTKATLLEPRNEKAHLMLGLLYVQLGNIERAMAEYHILKEMRSVSAASLLAQIDGR